MNDKLEPGMYYSDELYIERFYRRFDGLNWFFGSKDFDIAQGNKQALYTPPTEAGKLKRGWFRCQTAPDQIAESSQLDLFE